MKKYYVFFILGVFSAIVILSGLLFEMDHYLYDIEMQKIEGDHKNIEKSLISFVKKEELFLQMISTYVADKNPFLSKNKSSIALTQEMFYNLVKGDDSIMQLRLLDISGQERIRIDRTQAHQIIQIDEKDLQDKSNREYFKKFLKLKENAIGYSSIDLNVEYEKVEVPWRPTLRIAMPVFIDGSAKGLVIINFSMKEWMDDLKKITNNNLYLVDFQGNFIIHPKKDWEWSKYQTPSKKLWDYFPMLENIKMPILEDSAHKYDFFIKTINFFNNENMYVLYEPKEPIHKVLFDRSLLVGGFILLALVLILFPVIQLIIKMFDNLKIEKDRLLKSEENLSKIFDNTFDAMFVIDRIGTIKKVNKAAQTLFSYTASELLGNNIKILIPEPHHSRHDDYLKAYKDSSQSTVMNRNRELLAMDKFGKLIPISLSVTKIEIDGEVFFIGSIKDFTELEKSQNMQREQETMLLQQSKLAAMGEMINAIAHQWRQPLNSIGLIVQDLQSAQKYNELNLEYLTKSKDDIMKQLHHMSSTIDSFRNFFSESKNILEFNIIDTVNELHDLYWAQLNANNIKFEFLCQNQNMDLVPCDLLEEKSLYEMKGYPNHIKQILLNLVSNSKDAIVDINNPHQFQKKIFIELNLSEDDIIINVCDNAGGIPEDTLNRMFEPYFTTKEMGTGLGLFIIKSILKEHLHGTIEYVRTSNKFEDTLYDGSKFILKIPKVVPKT